MPYTILSHTADTGIEANGRSLAGLIHELASGMFALIAPVSDRRPSREVEMTVEAATPEDLVVDVLSELLYHSEVEDLFFFEFDVEVESQGGLIARVEARGTSAREVEISGPPVKAVTYHDLTVTESEAGWFGRVYFDV